MAFTLAQSCAFPHDLDAATKKLLQEVGDRARDIMARVEDLNNSPEMAEAEGLIEDSCTTIATLLAQGDGTSSLSSCGDISTTFGLEISGATAKDDERYLFYAGIIMVAGILYAAGSTSPDETDTRNIKALRRLFLAAGRSFPRTEQFLALARMIVVHSHVQIQKVPAKSPGVSYSDDEIRRLLNANYLTTDDIARNDDGTALAVTQDFLDSDTPLDETRRRFSLTDSDITTQVFHYQQVDNTSPNINKLIKLGYSGEELAAILANMDLVDLSPGPVETSITESRKQAVSLISTLDFILDRFDRLKVEEKNVLRDQLQARLTTLKNQHRTSLVKSRFTVTTIEQNNTLARLREKLRDQDIAGLLEGRPEVTGIYFDAPVNTLTGAFTTSASVGSSTTSNNFLNQTKVKTVDTQVMMLMASDLDMAGTKIAEFSNRSLQEARQHLSEFVQRAPIVEPTDSLQEGGTFQQGQPSCSSPADIILRNIDFDSSFSIDLKIKAIDEALEDLESFLDRIIAKPLEAVIRAVIRIIQAANNAIDEIVDQMKAAIYPIKQKVDAFMSQYLSLTGSGDFNSSLIKCAINFDIALSTDILDQLLALIDQLQDVIKTILQKFTQIIADMIEKLVCLPINLLNSILGKIENALSFPTGVCASKKFTLGDRLEKALEDLRNAVQARGLMFDTSARSLIRYSAIVTTATDRLTQFRESAACNSSASKGFMDIALLNLTGGLLPNPLAGALGGAGSSLTGALGGAGGAVTNAIPRGIF